MTIAGHIITAALFPLSIIPFLWHWRLLSQGQSDIEARGPWIWAALGHHIIALIAGIAAILALQLSRRTWRGKWMDAILVLTGGIATIGWIWAGDGRRYWWLLDRGHESFGSAGITALLLGIAIVAFWAAARLLRSNSPHPLE